MPVNFHNGIPIFTNNVISKQDETYYVSYNASTHGYGVDTTALVIRVDDGYRDVFYILSGDHREGYESCEKLEDCLRYLFEHEDQLHEMSEKIEHDLPR